jgi:hypothetical protein
MLGEPADAADVRLTSSVGGAVSVPVLSYKARPFMTVVPQKYDFSCGAAAVATLLSFHFGRPTAERDVFEAMFAAGDQDKIRREGFSLFEMKAYLESLGYRADGFRVPLDKVARVGVPVITLIETKGYRHFVVIKGLRNGRILVGDPALDVRAMRVDRFAKIWKDGIVFAIHNADDIGKRHFNMELEWTLQPRYPIGEAAKASGLRSITVLLPGPNDIF